MFSCFSILVLALDPCEGASIFLTYSMTDYIQVSNFEIGFGNFYSRWSHSG